VEEQALYYIISCLKDEVDVRLLLNNKDKSLKGEKS